MGTSDVSAWLGQPESDVLEYKDAEALKHPETIVRAVVAFLNGDGGRLIVGVGDDGVPRGVADSAKARDRLQQILGDRIEPRPIGRVTVAAVRVAAGDVLDVAIQGGNDRPYVELHQGRLGYWRRSGALTVPGSLAELRDALRAELRAEETRARRQALPETPPRPWTEGLEPDRPTLVFEASWSPSGAAWKKKELEDLWSFVSARRGELGRPFGWTVVPMIEPDSEHYHPETGLTIGLAPFGRSLRFERNGTIRFEAYEGFLRMPQLANMLPPAHVRTLNPYMVVEGAASFARLVDTVATKASERTPDLSEVMLTVGLWSLEGWQLPPTNLVHSILGHFGRIQPEVIAAGAIAATHATTLTSLRSKPDLVARRLAGNLWEELGRSDDTLPFWDEASQSFQFG